MAQNDPQWGNKGNNDGPPDLDEILRKLTQKLSGLFGNNKGGDGAPPSSGRAGSLFAGGASLLALLVAGGWLASGFYVVDSREQGVVLRFGQYVETTEQGLHWRWPSPVESHEIVNLTMVRNVEVGHRNSGRNKVPEEALMVTGDQNIIDLQFSVQYNVKDARAFLFNNRNGDLDGKDLVSQVAETAIREVVGKSQIDFILNEGRAEIADRAARLMQQILDRYQSGVLIAKVNMSNAQPPEQVQAAFDDAVKAGQDKDRLKSEGEAYANDVIPKARGLAARLEEEANAHRQRVVVQAEGDVSRFRQVLTEYSKAPQVTRDRMYLDTMQQILSSSSKVLIDQKSGNNLLYLPLDKLMQTSSAVGGSTGQGQVPSAVGQEASARATEPAAEAARGRDALRSREREGR